MIDTSGSTNPDDENHNVIDFMALAALLQQCPEVTRYDTAEEDEASTLAHDFADLEESFREILFSLFPQLMNRDVDSAKRYDLLLDIGEEFRHILYHIKNSKFYDHLD
ncbi:MAG TPA: hypothetical protein VN643_04985 [Pyrinomonadaceae bacterium]|nr:hypothetical protein [Pyrinomonadaceae bacterium]